MTLPAPSTVRSATWRPSSLSIAVIFERVGPYHRARLEALCRYVKGLSIEIVTKDTTYDWDPEPRGTGYEQVTLFPGRTGKPRGYRIRRRLFTTLDRLRPAVLALPGWQAPEALLGLLWAQSRGTATVLMSESQRVDKERSALLETLKRRIVTSFDSALVGGQRHEHYLRHLGFACQRVFHGYDVVDNDYFSKFAVRYRLDEEHRTKVGLPTRFFLTTARFVPQKNLKALIHAYHCYRIQVSDPWGLVLVGDGPERSLLQQCANHLFGSSNLVHFVGFKQYPQLPIYYGCASAFVLPSVVEPWGLVVNEAMASGLPIIVSQNCGCAPELVREGVNGFTFSPDDHSALTRVMLELSSRTPAELEQMGRASREIISQWTPDFFARQLHAAALAAIDWRARGAGERLSASRRALLLALALPR